MKSLHSLLLVNKRIGSAAIKHLYRFPDLDRIDVNKCFSTLIASARGNTSAPYYLYIESFSTWEWYKRLPQSKRISGDLQNSWISFSSTVV